MCALVAQQVRQLDRRRAAHVVSIGFERKTPQTNLFILENPKDLVDLFEEILGPLETAIIDAKITSYATRLAAIEARLAALEK